MEWTSRTYQNYTTCHQVERNNELYSATTLLSITKISREAFWVHKQADWGRCDRTSSIRLDPFHRTASCEGSQSLVLCRLSPPKWRHHTKRLPTVKYGLSHWQPTRTKSVHILRWSLEIWVRTNERWGYEQNHNFLSLWHLPLHSYTVGLTECAC